MANNRRLLLPFALVLLVAGCSIHPPAVFTRPEPQDGPPSARAIDLGAIPDAVPRAEPRSRYGNPNSYEVYGKRYFVMASGHGYVEQGIASWYGTKFHGRRTSSGEPYDMYAMTAAHKELPLPTYARVTNLRNGRSIVVKINDRGPFHENRIIDLSYTAAAKLGILEQGTGLVEVRALEPGQPQPPPPPATRIAETTPDLFIQVGAFSNRDNAHRLSEQLTRSLSRDIRIQQTLTGQDPIYRVQIGPLQTVEQADALTLQLTQLGVQGMQLVIDIDR